MSKFKVVYFLFIFVICSVSLHAQGDLKKSWEKILKSCSKSQIVGKEVLFFGPSNNIGLGSVWRRTDTGGYNPRFELKDFVTDPTVQASIVKSGEKTQTCTGDSNTKWNLNLGIPLIGKFLGKTGIEADLRNARQIVVSADSVALDVLMEVPFEGAMKAVISSDPSNIFVKDLFVKDRLIMTKAYRVKGLTAKFDYDPKDLEALKGKYPTGATVSIGGFSAGVNYSGTSSLTVKLTTDVVIAGEFSTLKNGSLGMTLEQISFILAPERLKNPQLGVFEKIQ